MCDLYTMKMSAAEVRGLMRHFQLVGTQWAEAFTRNQAGINESGLVYPKYPAPVVFVKDGVESLDKIAGAGVPVDLLILPSGVPPTSDIVGPGRHFRKVPFADIGARQQGALRDRPLPGRRSSCTSSRGKRRTASAAHGFSGTRWNASVCTVLRVIRGTSARSPWMAPSSPKRRVNVSMPILGRDPGSGKR